jgi:hypothetical protein
MSYSDHKEAEFGRDHAIAVIETPLDDKYVVVVLYTCGSTLFNTSHPAGCGM